MVIAVIDTNVVIAALRSRNGASFRLLQILGDLRWSPIISVPLILEYEATAKREASRVGVPEWAVDGIIDWFCLRGRQTAVRFRWRPALRDPNDEFVLELAVAGKAEAIVTYNLKDFDGAAAFGIEVLKPAEFLRKIGEEL